MLQIINTTKKNLYTSAKFITAIILTSILVSSLLQITVLANTTSNLTKEQKAAIIDQLRMKGSTFTPSRGGYLRYVDMKAVAYSAKPGAGTYSGLKAKVGRVAVDPRIIPIGSKLYIQTIDGSRSYGYAIAADIGTAVKNYVVDLFFSTKLECLQWGAKKVRVYVLP